MRCSGIPEWIVFFHSEVEFVQETGGERT